jgi:flavin reductase
MNIHDQTASVDARLFRHVMSRFATGVTVITAEVEGVVRGMTASSFMSVSLSPPLCLVSIAVNASMHKHLLRAGRFGVSILAQGQEVVSLHFAGYSRDQLCVDFEHAASVPLLKDASAAIVAETQAWHSCGDHTLFVGHVVYLRDHDSAPLIRCSGRYGSFVASAEPMREPIVDFW